MSVNISIQRGLSKEFTWTVTRDYIAWNLSTKVVELHICSTLDDSAADAIVAVTVENDLDLYWKIANTVSEILTEEKYFLQLIAYEDSTGDDGQLIEDGLLYVLPAITR